MAAADVAVTCLHEKAAGALLGARLRRAAADATLSCGATRAPSKTPPSVQESPGFSAIWPGSGFRVVGGDGGEGWRRA